MANNYAFTPGVGKSARSKEVSTDVHLPYVYGGSGEPTYLSGQQTITTVGTGSDTTLTVPSGATHALVTVDTGGGNIRYWPNGVSPSATAGLLVQAGGAVELTALANVKIRSTTGSVTINVVYYHYTS